MKGDARSLLERRLAARIQERDDLHAYPLSRMEEIVSDVGFSCTLCGKCCVRAFNGHVFLFDEESTWIRGLFPTAIEPAPFYDIADQNGTLYSSGFTIRTRGDKEGTCIFLRQGRCRIYENRPSVCRIYPYMLHRERGPDGRTDWRQISGLDLHGSYKGTMPRHEAMIIAQETFRFEERVLEHEIAFLEAVISYFRRECLKPVPKQRDTQQRRIHAGEEAVVMVYHEDSLKPWRVRGGSTPYAVPDDPAPGHGA